AMRQLAELALFKSCALSRGFSRQRLFFLPYGGTLRPPLPLRRQAFGRQASPLLLWRRGGSRRAFRAPRQFFLRLDPESFDAAAEFLNGSPAAGRLPEWAEAFHQQDSKAMFR